MKILRIESWRQDVPLTRPYTVAFGTRTATTLFFVRIVTDAKHIGLGAAAPADFVSGETEEMCAEALAGALWLEGRDPRHIGSLCQELSTQHPKAPAARAAVGMALYDLVGRILSTPVVDLLGRRQGPLLTSMTIGIKSADETLADCRDYLQQGFRAIKLKIGRNVETDIDTVHAVKALVQGRAVLRVDANQGYSIDDTIKFFHATSQLDLEFIEQPLGAERAVDMRKFPEEMRSAMGVDESLRSCDDALALLRPRAACRVFNIKLMKCGYAEALQIAQIGTVGGRDLMWGCMDESALSLAGALHLAYAHQATRYLDLDGHFDLAADPARGGLVFRDGMMHLLDAPGLGVTLDE